MSERFVKDTQTDRQTDIKAAFPISCLQRERDRDRQTDN